MNVRVTSSVALAAVSLTAAGCGSSATNHSAATPPPASASAQPASSVTAAPALNALELSTGTPQQQITATIQAFYKATWQNQGSAACSLFSSSGASGFVSAAHVAFPGSVNSSTDCAHAMTFFNAALADQVQTLQQAGVTVNGTILNKVGVDHVAVSGTTATAQAPEGVSALIAPKLFHLVRVNNRWLIDSSSKLGQTLPQQLAQAQSDGQLTPKRKS